METKDPLNIILRHKFLLLGLAAVLLIAYIFFRFSFIKIEVGGSQSGEITYTLNRQGDTKPSVIKTSSTSLRKLVARGTYEVSAVEKDNSSFSIVKLSGFFKSTMVSASLLPEKGRQFVGDNPSACMFYNKAVLYSYDCGGAFNTIDTHVPATNKSPTYTLKNNSGRGDSLESTIKTNEGVLAFAHVLGTEDAETPQQHVAHLLDGLNPVNTVYLTDLPADKTYTFQPYKEGFAAYDNSFEKLYYYPSLSSKPQITLITKPSDVKQKPYLLSLGHDSFLVVYSDKADVPVNSDPDVVAKAKSQIYIYENEQPRQFNFKKQYAAVELCGTNKLCLLDANSKELDVEDISGKKPKSLFKMVGVNSTERVNGKFLVIRDSGIIDLDVESRTGNYDYNFGNYKYCGLQLDASGYLLCLTNARAKNVALRINQQTNIDSIDKKIFELQKISEINDVSVYGQEIFISPNFGPVIYNSQLRAFDYNPVTKKRVTEKINQEIDRVGINRQSYHITITGSQ